MRNTNPVYLSLLKRLKHEIRVIESVKKKRRWKPHQKSIIDFINGATKKAVYEKNDIKIELQEGDDKKGFVHILIGHYKKNDLEAIDIINLFDIFIRGIKLNEEGVSNKHLTVYMKLSNQKEFRLVLNPKKNENYWVVTAFRKLESGR